MRIDELFSRPIDRKIEEVIKVDDESTILTEVEEYIPTDHIEAELTEPVQIGKRVSGPTTAGAPRCMVGSFVIGLDVVRSCML